MAGMKFRVKETIHLDRNHVSYDVFDGETIYAVEMNLNYRKNIEECRLYACKTLLIDLKREDVKIANLIPLPISDGGRYIICQDKITDLVYSASKILTMDNFIYV